MGVGALAVTDGVVRRWFCFGNVLIATVFVCADVSIPVRSKWLDTPVALVAVALLVSGVAILFRRRWAWVLFKITATILLSFGLLAFAGLALSTAFLFGIHGHFVRDGIEMVLVGFGLVVPYALAYPILVLAHRPRVG